MPDFGMTKEAFRRYLADSGVTLEQFAELSRVDYETAIGWGTGGHAFPVWVSVLLAEWQRSQRRLMTSRRLRWCCLSLTSLPRSRCARSIGLISTWQMPLLILRHLANWSAERWEPALTRRRLCISARPVAGYDQ
jgi:hypothetical protein